MTTKENLAQSIKAFQNGDLSENTLRLFQTLGYDTESRQVLFEHKDLDDFEDFVDISRFDRKKGMTDHWKSVDVLFQITDEEIQNPDFKSKKRIDNQEIQAYLFMCIELEENHYAKTKIAQITRHINSLFAMPVLILFQYGSPKKITLAIINRRINKKDEQRDVLEKITQIKDIDTQNPHRAHLDILSELAFEHINAQKKVKNFVELHKAWEEILDLKTLNKKFYKEIANWFLWASQNVQFPQINNPSPLPQDIYHQEAIIRLLTRFLFCWFLKEKELIPKRVFERETMQEILKDFKPEAETHDFYRAILQNLFFATLSVPIKERTYIGEGFQGRNKHYGNQYVYRYQDLLNNENELQKLFGRVPFLNGGLFECLDKVPTADNQRKEEIRLDGFTSRTHNKNGERKQAQVPDFLFFGEKIENLNTAYGENQNHKKYQNVKVRGLINILNDYKFTVEENTPLEQEIALDPELLGQIFENLLAFYNPETAQTARKSTGSFYTPREIVDYMVTESLSAYLDEDLHDWEKLEHLNQNKKEALIKSILQLKILDPACGSGAFPMGILNKLVEILGKIDPQNTLFEKVLIQITDSNEELNKRIEQLKADKAILDKLSETEIAAKAKAEIDEKIREIKSNFKSQIKTDDYSRKLYLIQNCIYGVDIQNIAIQIAKLRFFLALVIEQKAYEPEQVQPLPNLESKFVTANTLIGLQKPTQGAFQSQDLEPLEKQLQKLRAQHFQTQNPKDKEKIKTEDRELRIQMQIILMQDGWNTQTAEKIADFDLFEQNAKADWFDMKWMFGIKEGFDVVIGNPPYVQIQKFKAAQKDLWKKQDFKTFAQTGDIYGLFYEKGFQLLKPRGILAYITSNKWMRAGYGKKLRKYFAEETQPLKLIDFGGHQVFETATVDTNILIAKNQSAEVLQAVSIEKDFANNLTQYFKEKKVALKNLSDDVWTVSSPMEQQIKFKIEKIGTPLKNWDISINYGIKTGFNEAFIIDEETKNKLIAEDAKSAEIIKPILRGRDIKRYKEEFAGLYLINSHNGVKSKNIPRVDVPKDYPAIYRYLKQFEAQAQKRQDKGDHWTNLRNCAYIEEFEKEKIVWSEMTNLNAFIWEDEKKYCNQTCYFIPNGSKYILAILNSKLVYFYFSKIATDLGAGAFRWIKQFIEKIPIPFLSPSSQQPFEDLVDYVLWLKGNESPKVFSVSENASLAYEFERVLDMMVFELYFSEEMKKDNTDILQFITPQNFPAITDKNETEKVQMISKVYQWLIAHENPIRNRIMLANMHNETLKVIYGDNQN
ncbi:MAG: Eco57I restriction-modification methylase domain-containing protein [Bernardetiaceae bacterium]|nr:Eco57I restriction-modification methylase domain-containing protein [Bernardetiaceae bacterium]